MAENVNTSVDTTSENFLEEELNHYTELLISSREECVEVGEKYKDLSLQVKNLIGSQDVSSDDSISSDNGPSKEVRSDFEEYLSKYENRISAYKQNQEHQAKIVRELQSNVEEYRIKCARLEAALAEQAANESNRSDSGSNSPSVLIMDLDTALIRLEKEKNRCEGLSQINNLLREQLETATEVNQTLTSDVQRLTQEWMNERSEFLAKETEWKDEEQTFSIYFTRESNMVLSMWRQILNFKHEFNNLRSFTERELSAFKVCICDDMQKVTDIEAAAKIQMQSMDSVTDKVTTLINNQNALEMARLQERINELNDKTEKLQFQLNEKEKVNSTLSSAVEKLTVSSRSVDATDLSIKFNRNEKIISQFVNTLKEIHSILASGPDFDTSSKLLINEDFDLDSVELKLSETLTNIRNTFNRYHKQIEENNSKLLILKEQNLMHQRTIEFLEDERHNAQQLNLKLSSQFESLNQKMQDLMVDFKAGEKSSHSNYLDGIVKSLRDQIESHNSERVRLLSVQEELYSELQNEKEEKRVLKQKELSLALEVDKYTRKSSDLEANIDSLKDELIEAQKNLKSITLDKELLEQEKIKFSGLLSGLEHQILELKEHVTKLQDEERCVRESLATMQSTCENLSCEKTDLSKCLTEVTSELHDLQTLHSNTKIAFEKEKVEINFKVKKLEETCSELEIEKEALVTKLQILESSKLDSDEEKSEISVSYNDLMNQVTKYSSQRKTFESELELVREELKHQSELLNEVNMEKNTLLQTKSEFSVKLKSAEEEITDLKDSLSALKQEKAVFEKRMYSTQKEISDLQNEKANALRELNLQVSLVSTLQSQLKNLDELHKNYIDSAAKEKDSLIRKMDKIEEDFRIALRNEQQQHNIDIDILNQEKESLRSRLISSVDELFERHQKQQEDLISFHQGEIATLKKHITTLEADYEEKIIIFQSENKKINNDYKLEISSLEHSIENMKKQIDNHSKIVKELEEKLENADRERNMLLQTKVETVQRLNEEIKMQSEDHSRKVKELESHIKDLNSEKEVTLNEMSTVETKLKQLELEKSKIIEELEEANSYKNEEQISKVHFESKINLLQNQLKDEISLNEVVNKSFDDCKHRLKLAQEENLDLKQQLEETLTKFKDLETSTARTRSQNAELRETLQNIEKSRQEYKREINSLKRSVSNLEKTLKLKDQELNQVSMLHCQEEEIQENLRQEIVELKQKLMQSNASNEAVLKELSSSRKRSSDLEHKLRLQEERHQTELQEYLSTEHSLSVHRLNLEKSISDSSKDVHNLRSHLKFEAGKVLALESKINKLDGAKRDVENKLYSICLFLRSILNLGSDSGLLSATSNIGANASSAHRDVSETLDRDSTDRIESSHALTFSRYNSPAHISVSDLDLELLKSSLRDLVQNFNAIEKERDDLKDAIMKIQSQYEELRSEHSRCMSRIYQLQRDLEDKKNVEQELATKIASIHHHEEVIRTLEREKRRLTEKIGSADFSSSSVMKERENLLNQIAELKQNEFKLEEENRILSAAKELAESKAAKYIQAYKSLESDMMHLREKINNKELEAKSLEHIADSSSKRLESSEIKVKSMMTTIDQLNSVIEKHLENEKILRKEIAEARSQNDTMTLSLTEDLERLQRERQKHQSNLFALQKSNEQLRTYMDEYKIKSKSLKDEVDALKNKLKHSENIQQDLQDQMRSLQNLLQRTQQLEKDASAETYRLQEEKVKLDTKVKTLNESLKSNQQLLQEKDELCQKLEKEKSNLKKSLDKLEKDKQKSSELSEKSLVQKSSLGRALQHMEMENQSLLQKIQNLQAQVAELEERHSQRVKEFLKSQSFESKLDDSRLKTALKQAEQLMESRDRQNRQRILGLEEQIKVLQSHLEKEQERWRQYHQRSRDTNTDIQYLHSVLSKSLQNVSNDPQRLLPEAERLDRTTVNEMSTSGFFVSTPSKLRKDTSKHPFTSTPKAKKRLDLSSDQP